MIFSCLKIAEGHWSVSLDIPEPLIIGADDAANIAIRIFEEYDGELSLPTPRDLTLEFAFMTDSQREVDSPPFNLLAHLDNDDMLKAGNCQLKLASDYLDHRPEVYVCE